MGFKVDFSRANEDSSVKPQGDYECTVENAGIRTNRNGKQSIHFQFRVRADVPGQAYSNTCIFHDIWQKKEPTNLDKQVGGFNFAQLMAVGRVLELTDGKTYNSVDEMLDDMVGKDLLVTLEHRNYNDKIYEQVKRLSPTKHKRTQAAEPAVDLDFSEDGIPF